MMLVLVQLRGSAPSGGERTMPGMLILQRKLETERYNKVRRRRDFSMDEGSDVEVEPLDTSLERS